jgi:hypothetical protein
MTKSFFELALYNIEISCRMRERFLFLGMTIFTLNIVSFIFTPSIFIMPIEIINIWEQLMQIFVERNHTELLKQQFEEILLPNLFRPNELFLYNLRFS